MGRAAAARGNRNFRNWMKKGLEMGKVRSKNQTEEMRAEGVNYVIRYMLHNEQRIRRWKRMENDQIEAR